MDEPKEKLGRSVKYDSENRNLFDDWSTSECSILSEFGWTTTQQNLYHHHQSFHNSTDYPFVDFAMEKSDASSVGGLMVLPASANISSGGSGLAELASISNPSVSSSSTDQDPVEKSIGSVETPPLSRQIPMKKKKGQKRIRQQRFAFVTKSEVDHLEDGYRWRKYGQKAVKSSPYPRSYYRCTNTKCTVKKRVERSCEDPAMVITTYEGQHCHQTVGFPRGGGLGIRQAAFAGQMSPPNSQYYYPVMSMPQQSPQCSIASVPQPALIDHPASESIIENNRTIVCTEPQLPPTPQFPSDEGLLGDIVSPRLRNSHP